MQFFLMFILIDIKYFHSYYNNLCINNFYCPSSISLNNISLKHEIGILIILYYYYYG